MVRRNCSYMSKDISIVSLIGKCIYQNDLNRKSFVPERYISTTNDDVELQFRQFAYVHIQGLCTYVNELGHCLKILQEELPLYLNLICSEFFVFNIKKI